MVIWEVREGGGVRRPWKTWLGEVREGGRERGYRGPGRRGYMGGKGGAGREGTEVDVVIWDVREEGGYRDPGRRGYMGCKGGGRVQRPW